MTHKTKALQHYLPEAAVSYCAGLQAKYGFCFRASRARTSKWGDYRYRKSAQGTSHTITVNQNLNPYAFLITYLHEVAHLVAFQQYGLRIRPHGQAWKQCFKQLLAPMLTETVFPQDLLTPLRGYAQNPKASTGADIPLLLALRRYDTPTEQVLLASLSLDTPFRFRQRIYVKKRVRRTRALCQELATQKDYLILETTPVDPLHHTVLTS